MADIVRHADPAGGGERAPIGENVPQLGISGDRRDIIPRKPNDGAGLAQCLVQGVRVVEKGVRKRIAIDDRNVGRRQEVVHRLRCVIIHGSYGLLTGQSIPKQLL